MKEVFKQIKDYPNYFVSNYGTIKNNKGKVLKFTTNSDGYYRVALHNKGVQKIKFVHRIVADAFIPNNDNHSQVNHINEIKTDNRVCNLERCSASYNINYGKRNQKVSIALTNNKHTSKPVIQYDLDGNFICEYSSVHEASRITGINRGNIGSCCRGLYKKTKGYIWKFKSE